MNEIERPCLIQYIHVDTRRGRGSYNRFIMHHLHHHASCIMHHNHRRRRSSIRDVHECLRTVETMAS
jgi:hypothetical protein